ncbi:MAG: hypothetical protein GXP29_09565, partial [Planctomycetes bacterium]|nr:hypothetical protein [Planctomycetota bacterium]
MRTKRRSSVIAVPNMSYRLCLAVMGTLLIASATQAQRNANRMLGRPAERDTVGSPNGFEGSDIEMFESDAPAGEDGADDRGGPCQNRCGQKGERVEQRCLENGGNPDACAHKARRAKRRCLQSCRQRGCKARCRIKAADVKAECLDAGGS